MQTVKDTISHIVGVIENNLRNKITLDDISESSHLSKFHVHRIFKAVTGKPLAEYIRSRRMASSINDLLNSDLKIIDIAYEYNFPNEQSYIRSFKNEFGITPSRFRKGNIEVKVTEKIDLTQFPEIINGTILPPFFVAKPQFDVVGIKHRMAFQEDVLQNHMPNLVGNDFYYNHRDKIKNAIHHNVYYGITTWSDDYSDAIYYDYFTSLEVHNLGEIPEGMIGCSVPANKYGVFRYINFCHPRHMTYYNFKHIHDFIRVYWLHKSNHTIAENYDFERIDMNIASEDYCEVDIYVPIKVK